MDESPAPPPSSSAILPPGSNPGESQCLDALKGIGKALGQLALYEAGHPAIAETISTAHGDIASALALARNGELVVCLNQQDVVANGRVIGAVTQLPNAIVNFYRRFKLTSVVFRSGITREELGSFCAAATSRIDGAAPDPRTLLAKKGLTHVSVNEAVYVRAGRQDSGPIDGAGPGRGKAAAQEAPSGASVSGIDRALQSGSLERTIMALVEESVPDPVLRERVIAQVMKLVEADVAKRVKEVASSLHIQKKIVENDAARATRVIQNMVGGIVVVDEQGKILMMNAAAEQLYGETLAQTAGKSVAEMTGDRFVVTMAVELQTPGDRDISAEVTTRGVDDTKKILRSSSAVVQTEDGKVVGVITALSDETKHRELQKMQRDFMAHVTHELRAPLSSIRAALEIIQSDFGANMEADETRMLAVALNNSDRLASLINGILDFSKIESGQMVVFPKPVEPEKIAQEAVDSLRPWARKKRIDLTLSVPGGLPQVEADAPRTVQVVVNLLSNAIKFTPAEGKIEVKLARRGEGLETYVEYSVTDTGPGVPKEEQERVFEKFAQVSSGEAQVGGTGLGLSIAKALVRLQKGEMWIESEPGRGASFRFTLPVFAAQTVEATRMRTQSFVLPAPWWKKIFRFK